LLRSALCASMANSPTFLPVRCQAVGPLSWGLSTCQSPICPWCLLNTRHGNLWACEQKVRNIIGELDQQRAPHYAGQMVMLLFQWCREDMARTLDHACVPFTAVHAPSLLVACGLAQSTFDVFTQRPPAAASSSSSTLMQPPLAGPPGLSLCAAASGIF
jgi:hypothetical protein